MTLTAGTPDPAPSCPAVEVAYALHRVERLEATLPYPDAAALALVLDLARSALQPPTPERT